MWFVYIMYIYIVFMTTLHNNTLVYCTNIPTDVLLNNIIRRDRLRRRFFSRFLNIRSGIPMICVCMIYIIIPAVNRGKKFIE